MSGELQHCPECDEEYVAGVATCVECGGALQPGPLARLEARHAERRAAPPPSADGATTDDELVAELPGQQADHVVRMLLLEGIPCRVVCQGIEKRYLPGKPPAEPFAMTLPVTIFVAGAQRQAAEDIISSFEHEDVIGEQWDSEAPPGVEAAPAHDPESYEALPTVDDADADAEIPEPPQPTGTSFRALIIVVAIGLVLLFLFAR